jgi:hypothetical protein
VPIRANPWTKNHFRRKPSAISVILRDLRAPKPLPQEAIRVNPWTKNHFRRKPSAISMILRALRAPKPLPQEAIRANPCLSPDRLTP